MLSYALYMSAWAQRLWYCVSNVLRPLAPRVCQWGAIYLCFVVPSAGQPALRPPEKLEQMHFLNEYQLLLAFLLLASLSSEHDRPSRVSSCQRLPLNLLIFLPRDAQWFSFSLCISLASISAVS